MWDRYLEHLAKTPTEPFHFQYIEMGSLLERIGAFYQTGNPRVLPAALLTRLGASTCIQQTGWPAFVEVLRVNPSTRQITLDPLYWPQKDGQLISCAKSSIEFTYGPPISAVRSYKREIF